MENVLRMASFWLIIAAGVIGAQEPKGAPKTDARADLVTPKPDADPKFAPKPDAKADMAILAAANKADLDDISAESEKWATALKSWYLASLEKLLVERTKAGDLEGVLAFKAERERIASGSETTREQIEAMPPLLGKLRAAYEEPLKKNKEETARRKDAARAKYLANLEALQTRLTTNGDLDDAVLVRKEKERVAAETANGGGAGMSNPPEAKAPAVAGFAAGPAVEQISALTEQRGEPPITLNGNDTITTQAHFAPPVEITIVAKTDSTNLRMSYAAKAVIFNWERNQKELRVDGGPANGKHTPGAGRIPKNTYVTIRWVVLPTKQSIYVDDELRFEHEGDYSKINKPIAVFSHDSKVSVQSIKVRQRQPDAG